MKNFFNYLFYKYYWFQVRVGNGDIAPFFSTLILTFISFLYLSIILMIFIFFIIPKSGVNINPKMGVVIIIILFIIFYFLFLSKSKYKDIIEKEKFKNKSNFWAIFLPLFAFIAINICWILKMLQNQGKI